MYCVLLIQFLYKDRYRNSKNVIFDKYFFLKFVYILVYRVLVYFQYRNVCIKNVLLNWYYLYIFDIKIYYIYSFRCMYLFLL